MEERHFGLDLCDSDSSSESHFACRCMHCTMLGPMGNLMSLPTPARVRATYMSAGDDCSFFSVTSIADYSNIDEQIRENDRQSFLDVSRAAATSNTESHF
jgi:hypothetical protein